MKITEKLRKERNILRNALSFLYKDTDWESIDKDNMEFRGTVSCYQIDAARNALRDTDHGIEFTVAAVEFGHNWVYRVGTYTGDATVEDVKDRFYHPTFGGRDAFCEDGKWSAVEQID
jgi:hypothetical protein